MCHQSALVCPGDEKNKTITPRVFLLVRPMSARATERDVRADGVAGARVRQGLTREENNQEHPSVAARKFKQLHHIT